MFAELSPEYREIPLEAVSAERLTAGVVRVDELEAVRAKFGFSEASVSECLFDRDDQRNDIDVYEDYTFGVLTVVDAGAVFHHCDKVAFFFKKNLFLMVSLKDEDGSTNAVFEQAMKRYKPDAVTLEKVICAMLEGVVAGDGKTLAKLEYEIAAMEEEVAHGKTDRDFNADIYEKRKALMILHNYYEQLIDIGEELQENENDIFADGALHYFAMFTGKVERLSGTAQLMRDSLSQLRETYQAALDYNLNNTMKLLTVLATIFLPLTLIVGWYGMNFTHMPELTWEYGYPVVIAASVAVVALCLWYFKRKKLL